MATSESAKRGHATKQRNRAEIERLTNENEQLRSRSSQGEIDRLTKENQQLRNELAQAQEDFKHQLEAKEVKEAELREELARQEEEVHDEAIEFLAEHDRESNAENNGMTFTPLNVQGYSAHYCPPLDDIELNERLFKICMRQRDFSREKTQIETHRKDSENAFAHLQSSYYAAKRRRMTFDTDFQNLSGIEATLKSQFERTLDRMAEERRSYADSPSTIGKVHHQHVRESPLESDDSIIPPPKRKQRFGGWSQLEGQSEDANIE